MIRRLIELLLGLRWCQKHAQWRRSDFCGQCLVLRELRDGTFDRSPAWLKSEGVWPLKQHPELPMDQATRPLPFRRQSKQ